MALPHAPRSHEPGADRLARVRAGDPVALDETLAELLPLVRRWIYHQLGPRPDVDDATQDALIELARALPRLESLGALQAFARRITLRVAYRHYKRGPRMSPWRDHLDERSAASDPERQALEREALSKLHVYLAKLPERRRVAFVLCCLEGLHPRDAAAAVGTTSLVMRGRVHRARKAMEEFCRRDPSLAPYVPGGSR